MTTLIDEATNWLNTYTDDAAHAAALTKNGDLWIAAILDEIDRITEERDDARSAAEEEAAQVDRLTPRTIRTPAEADKTPAGTVLLDKIGDVWQHGVVRKTLWEERLDYWTTLGDEEGHDATEPAYPARIIYQPEEQQ